MTKNELVAAYEAILVAEYLWAQKPAMLERFMASVWLTITTPGIGPQPSGNGPMFDHTSQGFARAWKSIGGKGKPTLKAVRALPTI